MHRDLSQLAGQSFDLVIVGGGVHGAWIAWDAALRGLSVALIERGDFGQETSANSLKTVHGGLRYLQDLDIGLVRTMIQERSAYLRIAPHLVHPLPCLMPTYTKLMRSRPVMGAAIRLNDLFGLDRNRHADVDKSLPFGRLLSRKESLAALPGIEKDDITGGVVWYDGQIYDSERFTLSLIKSAAWKGAVVANYVEACGFLVNGRSLVGVKVRDVLTGTEFQVQSKLTINAAGPWVDRVLGNLRLQVHDKKFNHSLAMNILVRKFIPEYAAGIPSWPSAKENGKNSHMLFVSPWRDCSIVGTFHSHYQGDPDQFEVREEVLQDILDEVNSAYPGAGLELEDIRFVHRGFLPEEQGADRGEVRLVRSGKIHDHKAESDLEGLITVIGVKYTSARRVAEKAVDLAFRHLGKKNPACTTRHMRLQDGQMESFSGYLAQANHEEKESMNVQLVDHLVRSYGSEYPKVVRGIGKKSDMEVLSLGSPDVLRAVTLHAIEEEMAVKLSDVILRRTALGSAGRPQAEHLEYCAKVMGEACGWDESRMNAEIEAVTAVYGRLGLSPPSAISDNRSR